MFRRAVVPMERLVNGIQGSKQNSAYTTQLLGRNGHTYGYCFRNGGDSQTCQIRMKAAGKHRPEQGAH